MGNEQSATNHQEFYTSNLRNNHDDRKVRHNSRFGAERAKENMISRGKPGAENLNTYYNTETKGWYNGNPKSYDDSSHGNDGDADGLAAAVFLVGLAGYGIFCAGRWVVNKVNGAENPPQANGRRISNEQQRW